MSAQPPTGHSFVVHTPRTLPLPRRIAAFTAALMLAAVGVLMATTTVSAAPACTRSWDGGGATDSWSDADNWDGAGNGELPTATDHVCIGDGFTVDHGTDTTSILSLQSTGDLILSGGTLSLTDTVNGSSATAFTQSAGILGGAGTLTITSSFSWSQGEQRDSGRTVIAAGATATLNGPFTLVLRGGRTFDNQGTTTWSGGSILLLQSTLPVAIESSGTFEATSDGTIYSSCCDAPPFDQGPTTFHNTGTFAKTGGDGVTYVGLPFDNDGTVQASTGTLQFYGGGDGTGTGTFGSAAGALVEFAGGTFELGAGAGLNGNVELSLATLSLDADVTATGTLTQSAGILSGIGNLTIVDSFAWTQGDQRGTGHTVIAEGAIATIDTPYTVVLRGGRTFDNQGTVTWASGNILLLQSTLPTSIENSGAFEATGDATIYSNCCDAPPYDQGPAFFHNTGTFAKTDGDGVTYVGLPFDNDGIVEAASGTLYLYGGGDGTASGSFATTAAGALVEFAGGTFELGDGASIDGDVQLSFGRLNLSADVTASVGTFTQAGGTLGGDGTLTVEGTLNWTGGEQTDTGHTVITEDASATIGALFSSVSLRGGRIFENHGYTAWADGFISLMAAAPGLRTTIENSGTFDAQADNVISQSFSGSETVAPLFHNTGTFLKSGGAGNTYVFLPFDNDGSVDSSSGTIQFGVGDEGTTSGGFTTSAAGALIEFAGGTYNLVDGASLDGDVLLSFATLNLSVDVAASVGTFTQTGGTLGGEGTLIVNGSLDWAGGEQRGTGHTLIAEDATATIGTQFSSVTLRGGRDFDNFGTTTWVHGYITLFESTDPVVIENSGLFQIEADAQQMASTCCDGPIFAAVPSLFRNAGTIAKTSGSEPTYIFSPFSNDGTVNVESGTLAIRGVFDNYIGASRTLAGGTWHMTTTLDFAGADIDTNAAAIILDGPNARIVDDQGANGLRRIAANAIDGELALAGGADVLTSVPFVNNGLLNVGPNSAFTSTGDFEQADGTTALEASTSTLTATASQVLVTGGQLTGAGSAGPAVTVSGGEVAPGLSPGTLHVAGTYAQVAGGSLHVELGGTAPGTQFDVLAVSGAAQLGGTLDIELIDDFVPSPGDTFKILTASARSGEFASLLGTDIGNGLALTAQYNPTDVTLIVSNQSLSIDDVSVTEGDAGSVDATFTVSLAQPSGDTVTVDYATGDGSAFEPDDYAAASGTLTFDAGQTSKTITVTVAGDTLDEENETFVVDLDNAVNSPLAKSEGIGTILDDDPPSTLSIADAPGVTEGNAGTVDATFTVTLSPASGRTVSVAFATASDTALSPADFAAKTGTLTFLPGQTSKSISVSVKGDTQIEQTETFFVDLSAPMKANLGTSRATGTILDDDESSISVNNISVDEGDTGTTNATFTVSLSGPSSETVSVDYATADETAHAPDDYLPRSGTLTFAPGQTSQPVTIEVVGDTHPEPTETFLLNLSNAAHGVITGPTGRATIADGGDISGTPDFQLLISPSRQVLLPGGTAKYAVRGIGLFGFDAPVTLSTPVLPDGVTASWSVNPLILPGTSILTLTAAEGAELGDQSFVVRGTGGGLTRELRGNTTLDFGLVPICYGTVEGYVTDEETGAPVEDATMGSPTIRTDANGFYRLPAIALDEHNNPIEDFFVTAGKDGYWGDLERGIVICDGTTTINLELLKWRPASLSGTVVEGTPDALDPAIIHPTTTPIEGARLDVSFFGSTLSEALGAFDLEMPKLNPRNEPIVDAQLDVFAEGYWPRPSEEIGGPLYSSPYPLGTIHPDEHRTGLVVPLVKKCTGTLTGLVTDAVTGAPIADGRVTVAWPIKELTVKTDTTGHFTYPGVLLGHNNTPLERSVSVSAPGYVGGFAKFPMNACGDERNVEVAMALAPPPIFGTLQGHVYDAATNQPLVGVQIFTPGNCAPAPGTTCTGTDANGFYRLPNVPLPVVGQPVQVGFIAELSPTYYRGGDTFFMTANETTVHDFYLITKKFARLTGIVTDRFTGLPIVGAGGSASGLDIGATSDGSGHYLTGPILLPYPGDPTAVTMTFGAAGYWPQSKSKAVEASSVPFELNFDLLPICEDATVQGTVVNAVTQAPIAGADVAGGGQATKTALDGTYKLEHLHVGTNNSPVDVTIQVSAFGFHPLSKTVKVFCNADLTLDFGRPDDPGTIIVRKTTNPTDSTQVFRFKPSWVIEGDFDLVGGGSTTFSGLVAGSGYKVSETVPGGWRQASATCSDGSPVANVNLAPGEIVTCTFVNQQLATLVIKKTTDPDPDPSATSFGFTAAGGLTPTTFSLANGATKTFANVAPSSSYSVAEDATAGWHLASATCDDGSPVTKIDLAPGETVTCTFTNDKVATIVVTKTTNPDPDTSATSFGFIAGGGLTPTTFGLANGGTQTFSNLTPASGYSVAESSVAGWRQTSATCSDGSPITNIDVSAGETVTCTFVNEHLATLIVKKTTAPDPDPSTTAFAFTAGGGLTPTSFNLANGGTQTFSDVTPGSGFDVAETPAAGWRLRSATCSDGSPVGNVDLAPGETVTCTFVNEKLATLVVKKTTNPDPDSSATSFGFTAGGGLTPATFSLANGDTQTFSNLIPGTGFSVAEGDTAGWQKGSETCSDGSPVTNIDLAAGETVTCTFVNEQLATLIVKKTTEPDPDPTQTSFGFTAGGGLTPASFNLPNGGVQTFIKLAPGSGYSVAEGATAGWRLASATCSDGSPLTNVNLTPGETVTCTFVNRPAFGTIVIAKQTEPAGSPVSFGFTRSWGSGFNLKDGESATFGQLEPGFGYSVAETAIVGWQQYSATCSDGSPITNIDLSPNETVTCTFVNLKLATLIVRKQTLPSPDPSATSFGFTAAGGLTPSSFSLVNGATRTFSNVIPGSGYSIAEGQTAGWQQYSATCSDGSTITDVDLSPGETVTCTFVNRKLATLIVTKQTVPSPDQTNTSFGFTSGGGLNPVSFALVNGASQTFNDVVPGAGYSVAETVPAGWQQASATCSDRSLVTNIDLAPGETVTCTFVNKRLALAAGAHTIGFWQNKNGQAIIKNGAVVGGECTSGTWLRQFAPFQDLPAKSSCTQVAAWVTTIIKAANSSGASMNAMLKAQMLATSLSVYFSDAALGGNKIGAPAPIGGLTIDLKTVCIVVDKSSGDGSCGGKYEDVSAAFGGAPALKVFDALTYAASQSNPDGSVWYGNKKAVQSLAKDLFDAINNNVAFVPL